MGSRLDSLVVTAPTFQVGADFVSRSLGVPLQQGGGHPAWSLSKRARVLEANRTDKQARERGDVRH